MLPDDLLVEFYTKAIKANIKPIIGIEAYIAPGSRFDKQASGIKDASFHIVLLAENNIGYHNLLKLTSLGYTEGFYYRPRIDKEILAELNAGIICSSACLSGEVASVMAKGDKTKAAEVVDSYLKIFGQERFFIEIQDHGISDERALAKKLLGLAEATHTAPLLTQEVRYMEKGMREMYGTLRGIRQPGGP